MKFMVKLPEINLVKVKAFSQFVFLGLVLLGESLLLAFYFPSKVFTLLDLRDQLSRLTVDVKQLSTANEQLAEVDENQLNTGLGTAEVALPDEKKVAGLITGLSFVASASGVVTKLISFSPGNVGTVSGAIPAIGAGEVEVGDRVRAIPVTMSVSSTLSQFLDYLKKIQAASQLLGVTGINYTLLGASPGGDLDLLVYYLPTRSGRPSWLYIPSISSQDLSVLSKLSPLDIFNLPGAQH